MFIQSSLHSIQHPLLSQQNNFDMLHLVCIFLLFIHMQLRNHLNNAIKHQGQPNTVNLSNPETLQLHLETRLAQLESAINMELWQVCALLVFI